MARPYACCCSVYDDAPRGRTVTAKLKQGLTRQGHRKQKLKGKAVLPVRHQAVLHVRYQAYMPYPTYIMRMCWCENVVLACGFRSVEGRDDKAGQLLAGDIARNGVTLPRFQQEGASLALVCDACTNAPTHHDTSGINKPAQQP